MDGYRQRGKVKIRAGVAYGLSTDSPSRTRRSFTIHMNVAIYILSRLKGKNASCVRDGTQSGFAPIQSYAENARRSHRMGV